MTFEPEVVDWSREGDCGDCGKPLEERAGKVTVHHEHYPSRSRPCYRADEHRCNARHGGGLERCDLRSRDCRRLASQDRASRLGVRPSRLAMTAGDVLKGIRRRHHTPMSKQPEWLVFEEFDLGGRRADALALRLWTTWGLTVVAYEVKVDRRDLELELKHPEKRAPAMAASTEFWFATPVGLMAPDEVPPMCGLVEFGKDARGRLTWHRQVQAAQRDLEAIPERLLMGIAWRLRDCRLQRGLR